MRGGGVSAHVVYDLDVKESNHKPTNQRSGTRQKDRQVSVYSPNTLAAKTFEG